MWNSEIGTPPYNPDPRQRPTGFIGGLGRPVMQDRPGGGLFGGIHNQGNGGMDWNQFLRGNPVFGQLPQGRPFQGGGFLPQGRPFQDGGFMPQGRPFQGGGMFGSVRNFSQMNQQMKPVQNDMKRRIDFGEKY